MRQRLKICIYNLNLCDPTFPNTLRQKAFFPLINNALKVKVQGGVAEIDGAEISQL